MAATLTASASLQSLDPESGSLHLDPSPLQLSSFSGGTSAPHNSIINLGNLKSFNETRNRLKKKDMEDKTEETRNWVINVCLSQKCVLNSRNPTSQHFPCWALWMTPAGEWKYGGRKERKDTTNSSIRITVWNLRLNQNVYLTAGLLRAFKALICVPKGRNKMECFPDMFPTEPFVPSTSPPPPPLPTPEHFPGQTFPGTPLQGSSWNERISVKGSISRSTPSNLW